MDAGDTTCSNEYHVMLKSQQIASTNRMRNLQTNESFSDCFNDFLRGCSVFALLDVNPGTTTRLCQVSASGWHDREPAKQDV
ncbi:hypothetical protein F442_15239 [Phytophthora nicotianae P10297]|uniref:Uncharacterized protein n=3 Tax=Phytophthora nicotianae TaxID=4792 RepID=V9EJ45_PHYNI|nr:hypothetical protein F443_15397 [Phytophthora nicotianae P1569]ETL85850.1 hypothetical protein L917_14666 [Phytophthora nicotianae]ETM39000.1 hypothetical protein L914_14803 [Phytophthora nicotianae]ETP36903.1 hypothetical protein F442_15239 [Phytophthora nicotianae P10297]